MRRTLWPALVAGALIASTLSAPVVATYPGAPGLIAFAGNHSGEVELYTTDGGGGTPTQLTDTEGENFDPAWSPDGRRIAFVSTRDGNDEIYVMELDGSGVRRLTNNPWVDGEPAWSPDGARIAFTSDRVAYQQDVYVVNVDGTGLQRLTTDLGDDHAPSWHPSGGLIAFASSRGKARGRFEIWMMAPGGRGQAMLTDAAGSNDQPVWSPDGTMIVFVSNRDLNLEIYAMKANGGGQRRLTDHRAADFAPSWSPDGRAVVFASDRTGHVELLAVDDVPGGGPRRLSEGAASTQPDWQPLPVPTASVAPAAVDFPPTVVGAISAGTAVTLTSGGPGTLEVGSVELTGDSSHFTSADGACEGVTLEPRQSCVVTVRFAPVSAGIREAEVRFHLNTEDGRIVVPLRGTALAAADAVVVRAADHAFSPGTVVTALPATVQWNNEGPSVHDVADATGIGLFASGEIPVRDAYAFRFSWAAAVGYRCTLHSGMRGIVRLPAVAEPPSGSQGTAFTVRWASAAPPSDVLFDVQVKRPGASAFAMWKRGVTALEAVFSADAGNGSYEFRSRMRRSSTGASTGWSPAARISVG